MLAGDAGTESPAARFEIVMEDAELERVVDVQGHSAQRYVGLPPVRRLAGTWVGAAKGKATCHLPFTTWYLRAKGRLPLDCRLAVVSPDCLTITSLSSGPECGPKVYFS